jgi:signal peptidase II
MTRNHQLNGFWYLLIFAGVLTADRLTKDWALAKCVEPLKINDFLSFELIFNRGVSWGLFNSSYDWVFLAVSLLVLGIMFGLGLYTFVRWNNTHWVIGEILVLSGAFSNMIDRIMYSGVVDFILLSAYGYYWPYFNIADMCIVVGVGLMIIAIVWES